MAVTPSSMPVNSRLTVLQAPAADASGKYRQPVKESIQAAQSVDWQEAQERVLFYLKLLGIAPPASLDLARRVLDEAIDRIQDNDNESAVVPSTIAMRALHSLLADDPLILQQTPFADYPTLYRRWRPIDRTPLHLLQKTETADDLLAVPAIKRGFMRTKKF